MSVDSITGVTSPAIPLICLTCGRGFKSQANLQAHFFCLSKLQMSGNGFKRRAFNLKMEEDSRINFSQLASGKHIDGTVRRDPSQALRVEVPNTPSKRIQTVPFIELGVLGQVEPAEDKFDPTPSRPQSGSPAVLEAPGVVVSPQEKPLNSPDSSTDYPRDRSQRSLSEDSSGGDPLDDRFDVPTLQELVALRAGTARNISSVPPETEFRPNRQSASRRCAIL